MPSDAAEPERIRVDKWLWQARFFKTRSRAGAVAGSGHLRINGVRCTKPAQGVRPGDVLTFPQERLVRIVRIESLGVRRGPAAEAQALYTDLSEPDPAADGAPPESPDPGPPSPRPGGGRPTRQERREIERLRRRDP